MADFLIRTWSPGTDASCPGANALRLRPDLVLWVRDGGCTESDRHDGEAGLCVLVGHVTGGRGAAEVFAAWRAGGVEAVARLDGEFVALLHDRPTGDTQVVRDRVGFGHAYHWSRGGEFAVSTSLPWLVRDAARHGGPPARPSARGVALYLTYQYVPAPDSVVHDVYQVPAGAAVGPGAGGLTVRRLADFPRAPAAAGDGTASGRSAPDGGLRQRGERVMELIADAAAERLAGARQVGMMMSGGMDTSTNAVVLVERLGLRPTAFTATFREAYYDESAYAAVVSRHLGVDQVMVPIRPELITELPELVRAFDTPNADQAAYAEYLLAAVAREHGCDRVVTGEGGDEVLGPPQSHVDDLDLERLPDGTRELAEHYLARTDLADAALRAVVFPRLGVPAGVAAEPLARSYGDHAALPPLERVLYGQWRTWMVDGVYLKDTRVFRRHGITAVLPMMSPRLMEYVAAVPVGEKPAGLTDKGFLRAAVGARLPERILTRSKHKFWLPFAHWFRGPLRDHLRDHLSAGGPVTEMVGKDLVERLLTEHENAVSDHSRILWALLFLEMWWAELGR